MKTQKSLSRHLFYYSFIECNLKGYYPYSYLVQAERGYLLRNFKFSMN